ncbi:ATP-binding cassette, subfamily C, CydD [Franzmannia pantelleriensis]|uniref:ATP-binding cassette, subfamily C, CydD n=1 Tax=Franzmannia pantelleriensis TaxID=48727 RepID=A0A1G9EQM3_9GAMM|nr:thiol reductant ABC exporter subunit CydD [Halomonas pantelleriensis]SDK78394.1 ATP-binding cassette, subfamily C, CydD [Halomonas pantelleriensis]
MQQGDAPLTPRQWLQRLAKPQRRLTSLAVAAGLVVGLATIGQMVLLAWWISGVLVDGASVAELAWVAGALIGVLLLRAVAQWLQEVAGQEASLRIRQAARHELLAHIEALGPMRLSGRHSAALGSQLVEQVEALDGYFARFLPQLRLAVAIPALIAVLVMWLDWLAAIFLLLAAPMIPLFMALVGIGAERLNRRQFAAVSRLSGHFLDRVRGIATLQLFNRAEQATEDVHAAADEYRRLSMRTLRLAFLSSAVLEFFAAVAIAVLAIYIGFGLLGYIDYDPSPQLTLFSGLLILLLAPEFFQPLRTLSQHYHDRAAALGAADALVALLNTPLPKADAGRQVAGRDAGVSLNHVSVSFPGRGRVLGPLDLAVEPGECVVLVGPSGAGKSTLLQLIAGFVDSDTGRVAVPAGEVAWMDQRPLLIHGSLADNLRLVAPEASNTAIQGALEGAGLGELIAALPAGIDTSLGERGAGLSGGQAQRLALARVFLSPASLVLLDEPTASVDDETEAVVISALQALSEEGRTLILATHHPALMAMADRKVRLVNGTHVDEVGP